MLNDADLDALMAGRHADPFSRLGMHADESGRLWVRALLPGAGEVALLDAGSGMAGLGEGVLDEAGVRFLGLGNAQLALRDELQTQGLKQRLQFLQLLGVVGGQDQSFAHDGCVMNESDRQAADHFGSTA